MVKARILLIDDDKIVLRTIEKLLVKEGYTLTIVDSGQKALEAVKDAFYDLIITDIRMPNIDGIEAIKMIKKFQENNSEQSRFMTITGYSDPDVLAKAAGLGIKYFLMKPFDRGLFLEAIADCLCGKEKSSPKEDSGVNNKTLIDNFIQEQKERVEHLITNKPMPILGWSNTYIPEEVLIAAGFLPYRIVGAPISLSLSKAYLAGNLCSSVQSILECALRGDYNFLDGIVIGGSTDATRRLYDAWRAYINIPFCHLFDIPKFIQEETILHYTESIYSLIDSIKRHFKIEIEPSDIKEAVEVCNATRRLLTALNNLRKEDNPVVNSQEFLEICKLATECEKINFNSALQILLSQLEPMKDDNRKALRILLTGSFQDQTWILDTIEQMGAMVVCEDLCTRLRYFSGLVEEDVDTVKSIARRYIEKKPASASLVSIDRRTKYIRDLISDFKVDGVVYYILKFDDPYLFEFPDMKNFLDKHKIPVLRIETEHNTSAIGQIQTRLQAFIETLKLKINK